MKNWIIHGANDGRFAAENRTIGSIRKALRESFSIPDNADTFVNGRRAEPNYLMKSGDVLEFIKPNGQKGVGDHVWKGDEFCEFFKITEQDLHAWIAQGLKVKRALDGSVRITETAVDEFYCGMPKEISNRQSLESGLLTEEEAIRYLRLDTIEIGDRSATLRRYRDSGLLRGTQVSKRVFFLRSELDHFLVRLTERNPR